MLKRNEVAWTYSRGQEGGQVYSIKFKIAGSCWRLLSIGKRVYMLRDPLEKTRDRWTKWRFGNKCSYIFNLSVWKVLDGVKALVTKPKHVLCTYVYSYVKDSI